MQPVLAYLVFTRYGLTQDLIHHIKYENRYDLAYDLGRMYGQELKRDKYYLPAEYLIPVPLHWLKMYKRGYNQANEFAMGLGEVLNIPVLTDALIRRRNARSQTTKSRYDRWTVMDGQFVVNELRDLKQKRVVLVDDVITTGSTLGSCAIALLKAGVMQVGVISLAVVQ
jgi:ComF family protein